MLRASKHPHSAIEKAARKAKWLSKIRARPYQAKVQEYKAPSKYELGQQCRDCGRPISDYSHQWAQCRECYGLDGAEKFVKTMRERQLKMRVLNNI